MNTQTIFPVYETKSLNSDGICRLCGRQDLKVINIFSEEELHNNIPNKIEMYIPSRLLESRELPYACCLQCKSTILSWHNFVIKVLETSQRLSNSTNVILTTENNPLDKRDIPSPSTSLQMFHPDRKNKISEDDAEEISSYIEVDFEEGETGDIKQKEKEHPHQVSSEIEYNLLESHTKNKVLNISNVQDSKSEQGAIARRIRSKIDPKMIEAAKLIVDDRTYYNCKECGKSLLSPYTFVWHMRIHTGERPFMCDLCGKQFRVSQGLVRHLKETHKRIKNFPCDLCGRMFATKRNVDEHRRIHTNERPYVCALCSKSFKQKASLFVHNRTHSDNFPFKCDYCNQGFRTRPPLLIHLTKHTGQKPYPCDICGRCFRIKYELKRHKLVHSEEKPFVCSCCGLRFKQKRYLRNHFKANHTNVT